MTVGRLVADKPADDANDVAFSAAERDYLSIRIEQRKGLVGGSLMPGIASNVLRRDGSPMPRMLDSGFAKVDAHERAARLGDRDQARLDCVCGDRIAVQGATEIEGTARRASQLRDVTDRPQRTGEIPRK